MLAISKVWEENYRVYGARKIWHQMKRDNKSIARCTVERLMRKLGIQGVRRGKKVRTTYPDKSAQCPLDLVNRQFTVGQPNRLWVADFTHVSTWQGWLYIVFVVDAFKSGIVGWGSSCQMTTGFLMGDL